MRVLIVYASVHGSTAEVARFVGDALRARGIEAGAMAANPAPSVEGCDAVILGSAVHNGLWLPEMTAFVRQSQGMLSNRPLYLWLNCMRPIERDGYAYVTSNYLPNLLSRALSFRKIGIFAGKVDMSTLNRDEAWTLTFNYDGASDPFALAGDHRDWDSIRAWAEQIADDLAQVPASPQRNAC
jgi:menaquinone-dependent protoporphyrinogen oxidase